MKILKATNAINNISYDFKLLKQNLFINFTSSLKFYLSNLDS